MTLILASQSSAIPTTHQAVASPAPIPFRKTSIVSGSEVFGVLLTTLLFLAAIAALGWFARRQGWLDRWTSGTAPARDAGRSLAILEVLRISRKTTLYRVSNGKREFLLAESNAHIELAPAQRDQEVSS